MADLKHVLVSTDLSEESSSAAQWVKEAAGEAEITVLFVPPTLAEVYPHLTAPVEIFAIDAKIRSEAQGALKRWVDLYLKGVPRVTTEIRAGDAAEEIVKAAAERNADLIVITTHARSGWRHLVLGSVTQKVLREAACPVVVTRPKKSR